MRESRESFVPFCGTESLDAQQLKMVITERADSGSNKTYLNNEENKC